MNSLLDSLLNHAHLCPDDIALVDASGEITYRELEARIRTRAREFAAAKGAHSKTPSDGRCDRIVSRFAAELAGARSQVASQPKTPPVRRP